eukprot:CAMPEP_0183451310 /NCGR_PEP_ID=MMETSP0370-20130417/114873_1 /TAXON_ID=268820 /ORGANISM="Peridinium aciculiferum, Strain PAER-2" /LENGTH=122 /DNA_ID=CAMNT_0025642523 /DNA_START=100 /DNA_END=468 /DNA_ORIENTATION=+
METLTVNIKDQKWRSLVLFCLWAFSLLTPCPSTPAATEAGLKPNSFSPTDGLPKTPSAPGGLCPSKPSLPVAAKVVVIPSILKSFCNLSRELSVEHLTSSHAMSKKHSTTHIKPYACKFSSQ